MTHRSTEIGRISRQALLIKLAAPCQQILLLFRTVSWTRGLMGQIGRKPPDPPPDLFVGALVVACLACEDNFEAHAPDQMCPNR